MDKEQVVKIMGQTGGSGSAATLVQRNAAIPLYHQIYMALRDEIISGLRGFDSAMPTEMELAESHRVSRITARRALDDLAGAGLVERRRRTGTRVIHRAGQKPIEANIDQAIESLIAFGQDTAVKVVEVGTIPADRDIAQVMEIAPGVPVVRAVRLRFSGGEPLGLIISHLLKGLGVGATPERLTSSPMLGLLRDAGVVIGAASQTIEALVASPEMAERLAIEPRAALLLVRRKVSDESGRIVLVTSAYYRADRYRISLDMHQHNQLSPSYK